MGTRTARTPAGEGGAAQGELPLSGVSVPEASASSSVLPKHHPPSSRPCGWAMAPRSPIRVWPGSPLPSATSLVLWAGWHVEMGFPLPYLAPVGAFRRGRTLGRRLAESSWSSSTLKLWCAPYPPGPGRRGEQLKWKP